MENFINQLYPIIPNRDDLYIDCRAFKDNKKEREFIKLKENYKGIQNFVKKHNKTLDCYYGVALRNSSTSGEKKDCAFLTAIYIDIDYGTIGHKKKPLFPDRDTALNFIERMGLGETVIVHSGHGLHLYWFLNEPLELTPDNINRAEALMKKMQNIMGADSTQDVSRILRIPGTLNHKEEVPVRSEIITEDYSRRYSLSQLEQTVDSHPLNKIDIKKIKKDQLLKIFGNAEVENRSEADQGIITYLLGMGFSEDKVKLIFSYYPTTGKYHERLRDCESGAETYINHSIDKAKQYIANNQNNNISVTISPPNELSHNTTCTDNAVNSIYSNVTRDGGIGYSYTNYSCQPPRIENLTNFTINFDKQIRYVIDGETKSFFAGKVNIADNKIIPFEKFLADYLACPSELKKYMYNLCGAKIAFKGADKHIIEAIKDDNRRIPEIEGKEFGYDDNLEKYITEDMTIDKDGIHYTDTPILYDDVGNGNYLGFKSENDINLSELIAYIVEELLTWNESRVSLPAFAFNFLSLYYPFVNDIVKGKPYLMLKGPSGCGKTLWIELMQHFFGTFKNLETWTSTPTAVQVKGMSFKDSLFAVDDLKLQNVNEYQRNNLMILLQNYSDETARNRAKINLQLRDQKIIKGMLAISAEDLVITESSAIARGIIINTYKQARNKKKARELREEQILFKIFTLNLIQYILKEKAYLNLHQIFKNGQDIIEGICQKNGLDGDNLPRLINNFSLLYMSWVITKKFIEQYYSGEILDEFDNAFIPIVEILIKENYSRIEEKKPEVKFEEMLFELIENEKLHLIEYQEKQNTFPNKDTIAGYYQVAEDGTVKVCIRFNFVYKYIAQYMRSFQEELGHSAETIKNKLIHIGKIRATDGGQVSFGSGKLERGVYWLGDIPWERFDIIIPKPSIVLPESKEVINLEEVLF